MELISSQEPPSVLVTLNTPIGHSEKDDLVKRHIRRVPDVILTSRPSSDRPAGIDTESTMVKVDGPVADNEGFSSDGGKDDTPNISISRHGA